MAEVLPIAGTQATAKIRNPLGVIGLTLVTLGIYYIFWYYFVNREMKDLGLSRGTDQCGDSPGKSVVAMTLGALIIVPPFFSLYNSFKRMNAASSLTGAGDGFDAGLGLLLLGIHLTGRDLHLPDEPQQGLGSSALNQRGAARGLDRDSGADAGR